MNVIDIKIKSDMEIFKASEIASLCFETVVRNIDTDVLQIHVDLTKWKDRHNLSKVLEIFSENNLLYKTHVEPKED